MEFSTSYRRFVSDLEDQHKKHTPPFFEGGGPLVLPEGNPIAPICIIGYEPDPEETQVFRGGHTGLVRLMMDKMGLPPYPFYFTYVLKQRGGKRFLSDKEVSPWAKLLGEEIRATKCKATVLLGVETAWALLGTIDHDVDNLRRKKIVVKGNPQTNFFVTYSCDEVLRAGGLNSHVGREWQHDINAIVQVIHSYFTAVEMATK